MTITRGDFHEESLFHFSPHTSAAFSPFFDRLSLFSEDQYKQMVLDKTGGLFRLAVGLMLAFSVEEGNRDYTCLLNRLSLYFQIRDDYLNVCRFERILRHSIIISLYILGFEIISMFFFISAVYMQSKSFCEDLTEGKFSFPIIHSVNTFPEDTRLLNILRQKTEDVDVKKHAVKWMQHTGSMKYTRDTLILLHTEVIAAISDLGGHTQLTALVNKLDAELDGLDEEGDNEDIDLSFGYKKVNCGKTNANIDGATYKNI